MKRHILLNFTLLLFIGTSNFLYAAKRQRDGGQNPNNDEKSLKTHRQESPAIFTMGGMKNSGNDCYINAVTQCLIHLEKLNENIENLVIQRKWPLNGPLYEYKNVHLDMAMQHLQQTDTKNIYPKKWHQIVRSQYFRKSTGQQDAQEFLIKFIEDLEKVNIKTFQKNERSTITCSQCSNSFHKNEAGNILSLPIPRTASTLKLNGLLTDYLKKEALTDKYNCPHCKRSTNATKQLSFTSLPQIFAIHLVRFNNEIKKVTTPITDLSTITIPLKNGNYTKKYTLHSIVFHHGETLKSGHYTAAVKNDTTSWIHFNDDQKITRNNTLDSLLQSFATNNETPTPYLLFYTPEANKDDSNQSKKTLPINDQQIHAQETNNFTLKKFWGEMQKRIGSIWNFFRK